MSRLHWLERNAPPDAFPDVNTALTQPPGLLAAGGDLRPARLVAAYKNGIFPWYEAGQPVLWWCPDPRAVLFPDELHVSRSLRRTLRRGIYRTTVDRSFADVTAACAGLRPGQHGTWITPEMRAAYLELHRRGIAHSVETWRGGELVGGIYGVSLGRVFFGESMFNRAADASKVALFRLVELLRAWNFSLIDCQMPSAHLTTLGARLISRRRFVTTLSQLCAEQPDATAWRVTAS